MDEAQNLQHYTRRERNVEQEAQGIKVASNITCILLPSHCQQWGPTSWYPPHQQNSTHSSSLQGGGTYVQGLHGEREGARVLPVWYVGMRRLHGISNFFVELLNLLSDYLQRPRAQEAQQIFVMRGRYPEVSLSFRNSHLPGSFPWKPARGGFLCHALAVALPNQIQRMWKNVFCN